MSLTTFRPTPAPLASAHRGKWGQLTPWNMDEKLNSENMQKSSFLCLCYILRAIRAGRCRERRYADQMFNSDSLQNAPYRSQIFKNFFASGGNGALTPPNQNPADVPGPPSLCRICCVRIVSSTHHGRGNNRPHSVAAIGDSHDCRSTELANAGKSPTRRRPQDCEMFRIPSSLSNRTIRISDEGGWSGVGGT